MYLRDWIKQIEQIIDVEIYGNGKEPLFEGPLFNIPWTLVDYPIKREVNGEKPIYIYLKINEYNVTLPCIVINIEDRDESTEYDFDEIY